MVLGKRMEDHLRFAVCYWHTLRLAGRRSVRRRDLPAAVVHGDDPMEQARAQGRRRLRDVPTARRPLLHLPRPRHRAGGRDARRSRTATSRDDRRHLREEDGRRPKVKLLWGTANLFSNRRYMAGAATNPDPGRLRLCRGAGEERARRDARLGGANYVLWGGREGYETLLNTDLKRELDAARPLPHAGRRAQAQDRLQGHDPDRAEAEGADQAPVRLRRRAPSTASSSATTSRRRSSSTSSRTTPSSPATPSSTRSRSPARSASSARSTSTAATICSAGTPTSSP